MHRWFFAGEQIICKESKPPATNIILSQPPRIPSSSSLEEASWTFKVEFKGHLCDNEIVAVCGSADILGKWNAQECLDLSKVKDTSLWTLTVTLPRKHIIYYRYLVCTLKCCGSHRIVHFWETHTTPRCIQPDDLQNLDSKAYEIFGTYNGIHKLQRGWISGDAKVVQFKFYKAPVTCMGKTFKETLMLYVKITPIRIKSPDGCQISLKSNSLRENQVEGNADQNFKTAFAFCEVASLREEAGEFKKQPKYGTFCGPNEILIFHFTLNDMENTAYLIDLYNYPVKAAADMPPYHFGYQYVMPQQLRGSEGTLKLNVMCATKHRTIASLKFNYIMIKPLSSHNFNLKESYNFQVPELPLDIGHRGCGNSYWLKDHILRENTLNSFNTALQHGVDMIEFDVHLTRDKIPIVYHDYQLHTSRAMDWNTKEYDIFKLVLKDEEITYLKMFGQVVKPGLINFPLSKFTLEQLRRAQDLEVVDASPRPGPCKQNTKLNLPFPTLKQVLKRITPTLGFNIEIKWSQRLTNGDWQEHVIPDIDKNEYIDTILDVVLDKTCSRHIIFSSFDADICTMIRLKQNRYPVMFICHANAFEPKFEDPRGSTLLISAYFSYAMELLGIMAEATDILKSPGQISNLLQRNIRIFARSHDTRFEKYRKSLKNLGVDGVVYDRVNHVMDVEDLKQPIVLIQRLEKNV